MYTYKHLQSFDDFWQKMTTYWILTFWSEAWRWTVQWNLHMYWKNRSSPWAEASRGQKSRFHDVHDHFTSQTFGSGSKLHVRSRKQLRPEMQTASGSLETLKKQFAEPITSEHWQHRQHWLVDLKSPRPRPVLYKLFVIVAIHQRQLRKVPNSSRQEFKDFKDKKGQKGIKGCMFHVFGGFG